MEASRELGIYADMYWIMYLLCAVTAILFLRGVVGRSRRWRLGEGASPVSAPRGERLLRVVYELFEHRRLLRKTGAGSAHLCIVFGVVLFLTATVSVMLQEHFGLRTFSGGYYLGLSLLLDLFSVLALGGIAFFLLRRRSGGSPAALKPVLFLAALVVASGLLLEGVRMAHRPDPWGEWAPAGQAVAAAVAAFPSGFPPSAHQSLWWIHLLLSLSLIAVIPYTPLFHLLVAPANLFLSRPKAGAEPVPLSFDSEGPFGVGKIGDWNWRELLAADACTECGRCQDACPAWTAGRPLSPLAAGTGLKRHMERKYRDEEGGTLLDDLGGEEALWSCTTCGACDGVCPAGISHVSRAVDLRRHEVLMESRFPPALQRVFRGLEGQGNPWGMERRLRQEAGAELELPLLSAEPGAEFVLWIGCAGTYDPKTRDVLRRLSALLREEGIPVARLDAETCCGDPARRLGNEYLFQSLVTENLESLQRCEGRTLVTVCPHCTNTLSREYAPFGVKLRVVHHAQLLSELAGEGRLRLGGDARRGEKAVFHDPCYLARHNGIVAPPRRLSPGENVSELPRSGRETFCCGGGGGGMWMENGPEGGISRERAREIVDSGAQAVYTACPFCRTMLTDALGGLGSPIAVRDISEYLDHSGGKT